MEIEKARPGPGEKKHFSLDTGNYFSSSRGRSPEKPNEKKWREWFSISRYRYNVL
jgi:hypothetical protein